METRDDLAEIELFPEEWRCVDRAVEKRRNEFTTVRACVRKAFQQLGLPPAPIINGEHGEPLWPAGVVGSITHTVDYRGCALAYQNEIATVGIDAEPNDALPDGVLQEIALPREIAWIRAAAADAGVHWDRLLFCAKEAVYKAWFPLTNQWLGFEQAEVALDPSQQAFAARLLVPGPTVRGEQLLGFRGRWVACDGLILTAIAHRASEECHAPEDAEATRRT